MSHCRFLKINACILIDAYITDSNSKQKFTTIRFCFPLSFEKNIFYFINTDGCLDSSDIY